MIVPTWMTKLPTTFGSASGGSLKADQWRVVATLYAPLILIMEWPAANQPDSDHWLKSTAHLMSAILACTSHTVSTASIALYRDNMLAYLNIIKEKYEHHKFVPNHHAALHIPKLLEELGPAFGWWTFPFERLIRELQNVPTNSRMGKLPAVVLPLSSSDHQIVRGAREDHGKSFLLGGPPPQIRLY
jgi:hypothetical protein